MIAVEDHNNGAFAAMRGINEDFFNTEGRKRLARVITFGCKMNDNDSEKIMGLLVNMGYEIEPPPPSGKFGNPASLGSLGYQRAEYTANGRQPDLVILNTCCVRGNAETRFFGILGSLKRYKTEDGSRILAVCGCMMQEDKAVSDILSKYRYVDFIFGTKAIPELPSLLFGVYSKQPGRGAAIPVINDITGEDPEDELPMYRKAPPLALISVMRGCDNFCSYCIVPYVRGREQSRAPEAVVEEAKRLASEGYREITLLGQNVNSYGNDIPGDLCDFAGLLERLDAIGGIRRIRFMTSHPKDLSGRLIGAIRDLRAVCPQLHLPVQSGSTAVLERMNRGYSREDYLTLVKKIRGAAPGVTLTTDVIVGFPGESERDFDDTLTLVEEADFDLAYTFLFSPREGTAAAGYPDPVPENTAKERFNRLLNLQNRISLKKNLACVGAEIEVLCEGASKTNTGRYTGRTPGGKIVNFSCDIAGGGERLTGRFVNVLIEEARTWSFDGAAVNVYEY